MEIMSFKSEEKIQWWEKVYLCNKTQSPASAVILYVRLVLDTIIALSVLLLGNWRRSASMTSKNSEQRQ
jgi:hypothetical protein